MHRKRKVLRYFGIVLLLLLTIYTSLVFIPRSYNIPHLTTRAGTEYWNLNSGSKIAYTLIRATQHQTGIPILFLQGGPGGPIYDRNIRSLTPLNEDGFDIYLYDQVGCGYSNRLDDIKQYTALRHKEDLEEIIERIGSKKVILLAQSWGAILATLYAADHPDKIEKIIFTGPGPLLPIKEELAAISVPESLQLKKPAYTNAQANQMTQNIRTKAMAWFARTFGWKIASDQEADAFQTHLSNETNKSTVCDISKAPVAENGGGYYCQVMTVASFASTPDVRTKLLKCNFPVLIMKGQCDNQNWGYTNEYLEMFPDHRIIIIPNAGHSISIEQPRAYLNTIRNFLVPRDSALQNEAIH